MNTQKSVFNKISKIEREVESKEVELSEVQKVELFLIDDAIVFNKEYDRLFSLFEKEGAELGTILGNAERKRRILESLVDKTKGLSKQALKVIQELEQVSKELGISEPQALDTLRKKYKESIEYNTFIEKIGKIPQI